MSRSFNRPAGRPSGTGPTPPSGKRLSPRAGLLTCVVTLALALWLFPATPCWTGEAGEREQAEAQFRPLLAVFHVHSSASTGGMSLDQLAERAEELGLGAIILADNFVLRYEYGLPPLRGVLRRALTFPSVADYGFDRYLHDIADAQARHPRVLLVPGMEVAPHYYWTGSLLDGDLTMHNSQRNVIVLGLSRAEDYAGLPVSGNIASYRWDWETAWNLTPGLLLIPAAWLWRKQTYRRFRIGVVQYQQRKRYRGASLALGGVAVVLLVQAWPPGQPVFSNYDSDLAYRPYQAVIDVVAERGGMTIWSMPDARDFQTKSLGPLGTVTSKTEAYPEALLTTRGYLGFGGVYEDNRTAVHPGGEWDQTIAQYLAGERASAPVLLGELAFHGPGHDTKELDQVLTVLWVREESAEGLFEALRAGRAYGVHRYHKNFALRLDDFQVEAEDGTLRAGPGETLRLASGQSLAVRVRVSATDSGVHPITVTLIRSGQVAARMAGQTPFDQRFPVDHLQPEPAAAYRVQVGGEGEILSNPVFVKVGAVL